MSGWRQVWNAGPNPASAYLGSYTLAIGLPQADPDNLAGESKLVPQGFGFGSFKVAADGKLTIAGKTADGEVITNATFVGPSGQVLLFQPLYAAKGSLKGVPLIGLGGSPSDPKDNVITGALDWVRPSLVSVSARTYELGFGLPTNTVGVITPVQLEATGGAYGPLAAGQLILGLTTPAPDNTAFNGDLLFSFGGLEGAALHPNVQVAVKANNVLALTPAASNLTVTKLTVVPATGAFSGTFTLKDNNLPGKIPAVVVRTVTYQGVIVRDGLLLRGRGYFLLPEMPSLGPPLTTPTTSDILSGEVVLQRK